MEQKMHELTQKLWGRKHSIAREATFDDYDVVIIRWLTERHKELHTGLGLEKHGAGLVADILGLSEAPAPAVGREWPCGHVKEYRCMGTNPIRHFQLISSSASSLDQA